MHSMITPQTVDSVIYNKTFEGKTFKVCQHYSLCRENFCDLPTITYVFSALIVKQENFQCKTFTVNEKLQKVW